MTGPPHSTELEAVRADEYDAIRGGEERGEQFAHLLQPLFAHDPAEGLTLDVGAGTGVVAKGLARLGRRIVGIDRSHHMLAKATARLGPAGPAGARARFVVADATRLPLPAASVVDAYSVWLLHLVDVRAVLEQVARVLRPGGRYLVVPVSEGRPGDPPVRRLTDEMVRRLRGGADPQDAPDRVVELAQGLPFRSLGIVEGEPELLTTTAERAVSYLERRVWFVLQDVTDEVWASVVSPTVAALRALPDQSEVVPYEVRPRVLVLQRTG